MFGGLNDPDEGDTTGCDGAICEARDEMSDVGELVSYTDAASEDHDCAVTREIVEAAVGTFYEGVEDQSSL